MHEIRAGIKETLRTGIPADAILAIFDEERGWEDTLSLPLKAFSLIYSARSGQTVCTQVFFMTLNCYSIAKYLYDTVDLHTIDDTYEPLTQKECCP